MYDIAVIGGGASGFAAAVSAKMTCSQASVVILEKMFRSGKKLAATGNGKCNLSNVDISEKNYHGSFDVMRIIGNTPRGDEYFSDVYGVLCMTGSEGRNGGLYPRSNSANTVLSAIRLKIEALGIEEKCDSEVIGIVQEKKCWKLLLKNGEIQCRRVIIACGGYAGPAFGTDGGMLRILKDMGYKSSKICPAVAPLKVPSDSVKGLKGVRVKGSISAVCAGKTVRTESGEIQFNENNISGICVFNLAYLFQKYEGKMMLRADLFPQYDEKKLTDYLHGTVFRQRTDYPMEELLTGIFVKNLAQFIVKKSIQKGMSDKISTLKRSDAEKIAHTIKNLEFEVTGCSSWQNAQVTMGGIVSECVENTLESKLHHGIYFCGEILDVCGDCGGYNLQWAWSSGIWAGRNCAETLKGAVR